MNQKVSYRLADIAQSVDAVLVGDSEYQIAGISTLKKAASDQLSFLSNVSYQKHLESTQAGCVILHPDFQEYFSGNKLVTINPYYAFARATQLFDDRLKTKTASIHASVVIGNDCDIADDVNIAANVVLGDGVIVESGVVIGAGCVIDDCVTIERDVHLYPNVTIYRNTRVGQGSIVHSQVVIGSDGFGFAPRPNNTGQWEKIAQLGGVDIGRYVEIGAGTTIDRGALDNTVIGDGVKLDNQIQIAHNVAIGENTAIAGATAIAGSTVIGKRCTIAGAVGIIGHLTITDDVHITAMTLVTRSIAEPGSYSSGTPMNNTVQWRKNAARFNQLDALVRKVNAFKNSADK